MKAKITLILSLILIFTPVLSFAAVDASLKIGSNYTTGTDTQFDVELNNFQILDNTVSVLTISGAAPSDVKNAMFLDKSGWVPLTPYQNNGDLIAKFISDTGFQTSASKRVITLRINFNSPRNYVIGYTLQTNEGTILSAAAAPLTVAGGSILGESTPPQATATPAVNVNFTRSLSYGKSGADVTYLQNRLTSEGVYTGPITGFFGRLTQAAVKKYQTQKGISPANGVVGPQTQAALNQ